MEEKVPDTHHASRACFVSGQAQHGLSLGFCSPLGTVLDASTGCGMIGLYSRGSKTSDFRSPESELEK